MTYDEAMEKDYTVTRAEAIAEIIRHLHEDDLDTFFADLGDRPEYLGADVLTWLGY